MELISRLLTDNVLKDFYRPYYSGKFVPFHRHYVVEVKGFGYFAGIGDDEIGSYIAFSQSYYECYAYGSIDRCEDLCENFLCNIYPDKQINIYEIPGYYAN